MEIFVFLFAHNLNHFEQWLATRYNWNIVESGIKHHNPYFSIWLNLTGCISIWLNLTGWQLVRCGRSEIQPVRFSHLEIKPDRFSCIGKNHIHYGNIRVPICTQLESFWMPLICPNKQMTTIMVRLQTYSYSFWYFFVISFWITFVYLS
jgi:hypothetical protein